VPTDREAPSGGWKAVYAAMGASTSAESTPCPDCGDDTVRLSAGRRWCPSHGVVTA
jgi:hypothetical protein